MKVAALFTVCFIAAASSCRVIEQKANGMEQSRTSHPSLVLLENFLTYEQKYLCSGVIVSANYVLTTAQCVLGAMFVNVHVYAHKLRDVHEKEREIYRSAGVTLHPDFDGFNYLNDVALVRLPSALKISERPYAVAGLPTSRLNTGTDALLVGWGLLNFKDDNAAGIKHSQLLRVIDDQDCREAFPGKWNDESDYNGRICVHKSTGSNCVSDSGSPFLMGDTVYGLASFGQQIACDGNSPNGLQEVFFHADWIKSVIG